MKNCIIKGINLKGGVVMKIALINIVFFIGAIFCSYFFTEVYANLTPGADSDASHLIYLCTFIVGEIAVCTNIILNKLDEIKNKNIN
jgi:ABC-type iron transport system FetAB permease component